MSHYRLKGTSGSVINQSFPFKELIVVGSAADCDVTLDEAGVAEHHAEICLADGGLLLRDLGSESGTLLNGEPVSEASLASGDEIRVGTCRWMLQAPGLRPERILTTDVVKKRGRRWPRVLIWTTLAFAAGAVAVARWKPEWLDLLRSML
ncbi:MAG: FHA domain-containing protein [Xanthomonadales bacterium]|nr:FHA domain-containing protein [Xanthomonadales bacterium]